MSDYDLNFPAPDLESPMAFRLLQEAKQACGLATSKKLNGVTIHSPANLEDWLKPFGNNETEQLQQVAEFIIESGDATDTQGVIEAVNNNGNLKIAVSKYLSVSSSSVAEG